MLPIGCNSCKSSSSLSSPRGRIGFLRLLDFCDERSESKWKTYRKNGFRAKNGLTVFDFDFDLPVKKSSSSKLNEIEQLSFWAGVAVTVVVSLEVIVASTLDFVKSLVIFSKLTRDFVLPCSCWSPEITGNLEFGDLMGDETLAVTTFVGLFGHVDGTKRKIWTSRKKTDR